MRRNGEPAVGRNGGQLKESDDEHECCQVYPTASAGQESTAPGVRCPDCGGPVGDRDYPASSFPFGSECDCPSPYAPLAAETSPPNETWFAQQVAA